jgi:hypothetical protein
MVWPADDLPLPVVVQLIHCGNGGPRQRPAIRPASLVRIPSPRRVGVSGPLTLLLALAACRAEHTPAPGLEMGQGTVNPSGITPLDPGAAAPAASATCLLAGADEVERSDNLTDVAYFYGLRLADSCATRRLTQALSEGQLADWINYLFNYSSALFGCGLVFSPLPGGIDQFGLSDTDVVGVPSPMLGPDDAEVLTALYLDVCVSVLGVSQAALTEIRSQLERAAAESRVVSSSGRLSVCPAP